MCIFQFSVLNVISVTDQFRFDFSEQQKERKLFCKSKGKITPVHSTENHTMEVYWGSGGIVPRILDLGTRRI